MANEKNIGSVQASLEFDVQDAVSSLKKLDTHFSKHRQRMSNYATTATKHMRNLEESIDRNAKNISKSLDRVSLSMSKSFDQSIGKNLAVLLDALNAQTLILASSMNNVARGVDNLNGKLRSAKGAINNAHTSTIKWFDSTDNLFNAFSKLSFKIFIIEQGVRQVYELFNGMVGPGFQFASSMETLRIGMAGILASTTKMGEEQTTYAQGLEISEKILKRMQVEALRTTMTVQELSEAYQSTLAGGLNAGMDLEQIMDLTVAAANAVKSFGLPKQQVIQELRGLISGEAIRPGVDMLGTVLGYTTATVNQLRKEGKLYEDIMKRMEGFKMATYDLDTTWAGMMNNMIDGFNKLAGSAVEGLFGNMKRRVKEIRKAFYDLKQEEQTFTNEKTGKQETRTVTTDIIINKETQKRLTMLYDTIDNFIELVYTLGKNSIPLLVAAFDTILPSINAFLVLAKEVASYLSVIPGIIGTVIDWVLKIPSAVLNGIGTVIDTFWLFTMNIIAAKHELKKMASSISESVSEYGAFALALATTGGLVIGLVTSLISLKEKMVAYAATQKALNGLLIVWNHLMNMNSLGQVVTFLIDVTGATKMASIAQATYNAVLVVSKTLFKLFTGEITLATLAQTAYSAVTKGTAVAISLLNKGLLSALKSIGLFLAKITALALASAVLVAEFLAVAVAVGSIVYLFYKISDETSALSKKWLEFKNVATGVWDGIANRIKYALTGEEQYLKKSQEAFESVGDSWEKVKDGVSWGTALDELKGDVTKLKDSLKGAISFKDILDPKVDNSKLPNVKSLFPAGAGDKEKEAIEELVKKYKEGISFNNKLLRLEEQRNKLEISMHAGDKKRMVEQEAKVKTYTDALNRLNEQYRKDLGTANSIADVKVRDELIERLNKQYTLESQILEAKKKVAEFDFNFKNNQEKSQDIVTRVFGEYGDLEVKLAKNKELLTNFMKEVDAITASGGGTAELLNKGNYSDKKMDEKGSQSMIDKLLTTPPEKLLEEYEQKKNQFTTFADFIKTKMAEVSKAEEANTKVQQKWMDLKNQYLQDLALGMGDAVYAWISGAQDIGQAMRDMVQELLRNALKLLLQWYTIFGIVSAFSGAEAGAKAANKMVLGISDSNKMLFKAEGGLIEGSGSTTGDSRLAALSPGEYVIRASAVRKLGVGYLDALNSISAKRPSGILPPISRVGRRFAEGGYVENGGYTPKTEVSSEGNNGGGNVVFNMTFQSLNPEAGAEMMKEQLPFIKNAVVNWMRNDTSVRTATRGAAR